eukprot:TRINITY_DN29928_c0_g1_i2.p1 TRINITY_DN29928_c0_g1~~TRINITY_DN29928_c0_g1_i2.p1  ORF type:complete len:737 (-),score=166.33 TRINITY_DN29928_c0_g1_i2:210-2348(-)
MERGSSPLRGNASRGALSAGAAAAAEEAAKRERLAEAISAAAAALRGLESVPSAMLSVGDEIGKGRFKRVHRGRYKRKEVVILRYSKDTDSNELRILAALSNSGDGTNFVPDVYGVCDERYTISVIQDIAAWGALKVILKHSGSATRKLTPTHKLYCSAQLARGMAFLEMRRVIHNDLSCRNVLLFRLEAEPSLTEVKITDFGLSVLLQGEDDFIVLKQPQATRWCAPETIAKSMLSHRTDCWSLGTTIWEMFSGGIAPWERREKRGDVHARLKDLCETGGKAEGGEDVSEDFPIVGNMVPRAHKAMLSCFRVDEHARPRFPAFGEEMDSVIRDVESKDADGQARAGASATTMGSSPNDDASAEEAWASNGDGDKRLSSRSPSRARGRWSPEADAAPEAGQAGDAPAANGVEPFGARFKVLRAFLSSTAAGEAVSEEALQTMRRELDEAQAREAYLMDLCRRMQAHSPTPAEGSRTPECSPYATGHVLVGQQYAGLSPYSMPLLAGAGASGQLLSGVRSASRRELSRSPGPMARRMSHSGLVIGSPSQERLTLTPAGAWVDNSKAPPGSGIGLWTLWSFSGPVLRRQDFAGETEARMAFEALVAVGSPCMLRDPTDAEAAANSWVASYQKQVQSHPSVAHGSVMGTTGGVVAPSASPQRRQVSPLRVQQAALVVPASPPRITRMEPLATSVPLQLAPSLATSLTQLMPVAAS